MASQEDEPIIPDLVKQRMLSRPDTLGMHRQHPEMSLDCYCRYRRGMVAERAMSRKRLYLDQRYWIYCRDAHLGHPQRPLHAEIWGRLQQAVDQGLIWCPVSYSVLA